MICAKNTLHKLLADLFMLLLSASPFLLSFSVFPERVKLIGWFLSYVALRS